MTTADYLHAFRRSFWLIVLVTAAFTAIAVAAFLQRSDQYVSRAQLLLAPVSRPNVNDVYVSQQIIQRNLATYAAVVTSPAVLDPVAEALGAPSGNLASQIEPSYTAPEAIITVSGAGASPAEAQQITQAVTEESVRVLNLPPEGEGAQIVNASVISPADLPTEPDGPPSWFIVLGGFVAGLLVGLALALLRVKLDGSIMTVEQAGSALGIPILGTVPSDFSVANPDHRNAALMTAAVMSRSWPDKPHAVLIAPSDDSVNANALVQGLGHGFQQLGLRVSAFTRDRVRSASQTRRRSARVSVADRNQTVEADSYIAEVKDVRHRISSAPKGSGVVLFATLPVPTSPEALVLADGTEECVLALRSGRTTETTAKEALRILNAAGVRVRGAVLTTR